MPEVTVEIEVYCGTCGAGLCNQSTVGQTQGRGQQFIKVEVCEHCMDHARDEGFDQGHAKGLDEGQTDAAV